jgi:hypothetical protein
MLLWGSVWALAIAVGGVSARASEREIALAVTMTNDPASNEIVVYDAARSTLVQTLSTLGKGGVAGNARGVRQYNGELVAAVNNGSNTVALFRRVGNALEFEQLVTTTSAPVSIDFGNGHMYVAGATSVDSFRLRGNTVHGLDGTIGLSLASGGVPPVGSTAQIGVLDDQHLLVTLKADPDPGAVDIVPLVDGAVSGVSPTVISAPAGTLTPFGFAVFPDKTALVTLAHSNQDGLFRDGTFRSVADAGQAAPCWMTRVGIYALTANTGSQTITRLIGTGSHVFVDAEVAAPIATGGAPADIDAAGGVLGVIDHGAGQSHLSLFTYNRFAELAARGAPITIDAANANGIAILPPSE